jgi:hypothetical protein
MIEGYSVYEEAVACLVVVMTRIRSVERAISS